MRATASVPALHAKTETKIKFQLTLPEELHDQFAARADKNGRKVEAEIIEHLRRTAEYTSTQPIYFNDEQRARLQKAVGHLIAGPEDLLSKLGNMISLNVGDISVPLSDRIQVRLKSRVFRGQTLQQVVTKEVTEALERFTGLRPY